MTAKSVLIVDDHPIFGEALSIQVKRAFEDQPSVDVAGSMAAALQALDARGYDLVLFDFNLPDAIGEEALKRIVAHDAAAIVVVISGSMDADEIHRTLAAGAAGFFPKTMSPETLRAALALVMAGGTYVPREVALAPISARPAASSAVSMDSEGAGVPDAVVLSDRERLVLDAMIRGLSNKEIARQLGLAEVTIKLYVRQILRKFDVKNRAGAVALAVRLGIDSAKVE